MDRRLLLAIVAVPLAVTGCASAPTHILTLDAVAPMGSAVRTTYAGPPIAVPAVHVPAGLDRTEFVTEVSAGEARIDDQTHWAAPLGLLIRDALVRDLIARLPAGSVLPPGTAAGAGSIRTIDVTILALDVRQGGAFLQAAYRVLPNGPLRQANIQAATSAAPTPAESARAFAQLIGQLADQIAADQS